VGLPAGGRAIYPSPAVCRSCIGVLAVAGAPTLPLCCMPVEDNERGRGTSNNVVTLVVAVLVILLLIWLILQFV
jgi:hypothetical protein